MVAAGTMGIGLATAQALAEAGCKVAVCGRDKGRFNEALSLIGGVARADVCDVSSAESIERWVATVQDAYGTVDILVTNTGGPPAGTWPDLTDEMWQSGFDATLMNIVRMVRMVSPGMQEQGWGRIVHVTSLVAVQPSEILAISSTLRSGIRALTRLQSDSLAPHGVTVNGVLPGHTLTDRQRHLAGIRADREGTSVEEALEAQGRSVPVGRLADPREIGDAVAFLCSQRASYITGVSLVVDGGLVRGLG